MEMSRETDEMLSRGREGCDHEWVMCGDDDFGDRCTGACPFGKMDCSDIMFGDAFCKKCGKEKQE